MTLERLKALVDGVIAIVLTLLVLLIEPPPPDQATSSVLDDLFRQRYYLIAYVISFLLISVYWLNHNAIFRFVKQGSLGLVWLNLLFLLLIAFIPFPTTLLVEYRHDEIAVVVYGVVQILCSSCLLLMWFYAARHDLLEPGLDSRKVSRTTHKLAFAPFLYGIAILASFWHEHLGLALFLSVPIYHLVIDRSDLYHLVPPRRADEGIAGGVSQ